MVKSTMQILSLLFLSLLSSSLTATATANDDVVKNLDVKKYMGRWYEIASFPSFFVPKNGEDTRATYKLRKDGTTIDVLNETWVNGKRMFAKAIAYKANASSDEAKLKVKFFVSPVAGDYWVLDVDRDYRYAIVGAPSQMNLFILYRKTRMDEEIYKKLLKKAKNHGYDVSKLHKTPQSNPPPPEADQAPEENGSAPRIM